MTQEDLMVNDWYYDCGYKRNCQWYLSDYTEIDANMIAPIPLTEDILKANGWEGTPTEDMYIYMPLWDDYMIEVLPSEGANIFRFLNKQGLVDMYKESVVIHFHYVHELQHILRVCGLNGLADNFKLKKD